MTPRIAAPLTLGLLAACTWVRSPTPCVPDAPVSAPRAAGCLTVRDGAILLVRTSAGWSIPGGYVDAGEGSAQAAVRETGEEAGVTVTAGPVACTVPATGFVAHTCTPVAGAAPTADGTETSDARWFDAEALRALPDRDLRFPDQRPAYLRAIGG